MTQSTEKIVPHAHQRSQSEKLIETQIITKKEEELNQSQPAISTIVEADLNQIVDQIFIEEYDPKNILRLAQRCEADKSFSFRNTQLGLRTSVPIRIFELLSVYMQSQEDPVRQISKISDSP